MPSQSEIESRRLVRLGKERVESISGTAFPGHHPGESHHWDLTEFKAALRVQINTLSESTLEFDIVGVDASVANALRRIVISEVPTVAIETVYVWNNTSIVQDEVLAQRLGLIPLAIDPRKVHSKQNLNTIVFNLVASCERRKDVQKGESDPHKIWSNSEVLSSQIDFDPKGSQLELFADDLPRAAAAGILLAKMRGGQEIVAELHCNKGIGKEHAKWSPVATASYRLLPTIAILAPIPQELHQKFELCFPPGVIDTSSGEAVVADARRDTVSREVLRHPEFEGKVALGRLRDHFICTDPISAAFDDNNVISLVSLFPPARAFHIADPVAIKHVLADRQRYTKPTHLYKALGHYGMNLAVAEGETLRRHKKIVTGSFTEVCSSAFQRNESEIKKLTLRDTQKTNELAWGDSVRVVEELLADWERSNEEFKTGKRQIRVDNFLNLTLKSSLFIIMASSFGQRPPWRDDEPSALPTGHTLPFREVMNGIYKGCMIKIMAPEWSYRLPFKKLRYVDTCYREFGVYIREAIAERRQLAADPRESVGGHKDLLGALVYASADIDGEEGSEAEDIGSEKKRATLNDDELRGSMYLFLLAGHETSGNTVAFVFILLALYQEEQERLFQHVTEILPNADETSYADYAKLVRPSLRHGTTRADHWCIQTRVHAAFKETLRLYPAAVVIPKFAVADTVIPTSPLSDGTPGNPIFVPKWTEIFINNVALGRSKKNWGEDADVFRPDRFIDAVDGSYHWPRDAYLGFSAGHRICLGEKFATVTSTAIIAFILRKYSVHLPEDVDGTGAKRAAAGESFQQKVQRITKCSSFIAAAPNLSSLVFRER
ncbi:DNA-directed RNA polymerases I and III subunit RPAC1, partial [Phenoliferia sp. Uapishka_3]